MSPFIYELFVSLVGQSQVLELGISKLYFQYKFSVPSFLSSEFLALSSIFGGDEEIRTPDPLLARQVLSQLSYTPIFDEPFVFL